MATRILMVHSQIIRLKRLNSRNLSSLHRFFSNQDRGSSETANSCQNPSSKVESTESEPVSKWLDIKAGIFGPKDHRFRLPGNIGLSENLKEQYNDYEKLLNRAFIEAIIRVPRDDLLDTIREKDLKMQSAIVSLNFTALMGLIKSYEEDDCIYKLDFQSYSCPKLLRKDFQSLFPNIDIKGKRLTVVTMCQKTKFDMSGWSEDIDTEREMLACRFAECAGFICSYLRQSGFWADFIDPCSGRPHMGPFTNATFYETDNRFRHFGLRVEDLGCCKVISHPEWNANVYVGAIFTDAPTVAEAEDSILGLLFPPKKK